jgi:hypothetical protein
MEYLLFMICFAIRYPLIWYILLCFNIYLKNSKINCRHRVVRYLWWRLEETWGCKINLENEHDEFRVVQTLSWSNNHTSSFCCIMLWNSIPDELWVATYITGEPPHRYNMFLILLQSLQIRSRLGLYLELHSASWAVAAIGPLALVDIYGIFTCP